MNTSEVKLIILLFSILYMSFSLFGQKGDYILKSSSQVIITNGETLVGHFSELDIENFKFKQCTKEVFLTPSTKYKREYVRWQDTHYKCDIEGQITNGKRDGVWTFWFEQYYPNSNRNNRYLDEVLKYANDSIYISQNKFGVAKELVYNLDSSFIKGNYILQDRFNISVNCNVKLKNNCTYSNNSQIIANSSISDLQMTIDKIEYKYLNGQFRK
jgi:hypothetical protein